MAEQPRETVSGKIAGLLERWSGWLLLIAGILTFLFAIPIFTMAPDETASDSPGGAVYDLQNLIDHTLPPRVHLPAFLVEATNRDILTQAPLWELFQNTVKLREADLRGELHPPDLPKQPYLYNGFDANRQVPVVGVFTLADAVQEALRLDPRLATDLEHATDEQVKLALHLVFGDLRINVVPVVAVCTVLVLYSHGMVVNVEPATKSAQSKNTFVRSKRLPTRATVVSTSSLARRWQANRPIPLLPVLGRPNFGEKGSRALLDVAMRIQNASTSVKRMPWPLSVRTMVGNVWSEPSTS